ncbi:TPA: hypothetical protein ACX38W_005367 [Klebsiella pneumoniae]|nr:hypothetical protein [Klebsiella pneumoniae]ELB6483736.1 hypothetical protein [Raoultella ornithinolytica]MBD7761821.1 hypothetical protein [Klebsiella pneumoniae]MBD7776969.1 hypothetical protein [Klebsiella pneumoniae]MCI7991850.1 hypothetical protein [Klebsiella pneumoniae]MDC6731099.1 hypothetical protein [Klebsiella pneumoniae]
MKFVCMDYDADFLAKLERNIAESMTEFEKYLAYTEAEFEAMTASLAAEPLQGIELDDLVLDDDIDLDVVW